jgi:6-pyruvoyltetrahydropterin/6-carboxytetrahydropterin synthase
MYYTLTKTYDNLKAAHRQWRHAGHCSFVHGENWTLDITFQTKELDYQNFVYDFGALRPLRSQLESIFDHTLLIDADDPARSFFEEMHERKLADVRFLPSSGAEGLAKYVFDIADQFIREATTQRVHCLKVSVYEDSRNQATYVQQQTVE